MPIREANSSSINTHPSCFYMFLIRAYNVNNKLSILSVAILTLFLTTHAYADSEIWKDRLITEKEQNLQIKARALVLDELKMKKQLGIKGEGENLSLKPISEANKKTFPIITLPLPQGESIALRATTTTVMAPELAKQFPDIHTWQVQGVDDKRIHGRVDQTPEGFHAMLVMPDGDTVFIEPDKNSDNKSQYISFSKQENILAAQAGFQCRVKEDNNSDPAQSSVTSGLSQKPLELSARATSSFRVYRLAIAATGEYTQYHGGTKARALSAIVTTINRVNEVYERDLGISLQLIADETKIIYTDPNRDPYTGDDIDLLIEENVINLTRGKALSRDKFDLAHVFSAVNLGGLAQNGSVCSNLKAGGVSGILNAVSDAFDISFVAHEIGHQLGATHTFNSSCSRGDSSTQRFARTAIEPGSGSTIMSYAGICRPNNLQSTPDPQFHTISINQIVNYTRDGAGSHCGFLRKTSNQQPDASAGPDNIIPTETPFMLVADGADSDGDVLNYTWEQFDIGSESDVDVDTGDNAIIRSRLGERSRIRYIPRLKELFLHKTVVGERLLNNDRELNFVVTIRDGKGGVTSDKMKMKVVSMGRPFSVTSHRFKKKIEAGEKVKVTWDVAGTNRPPINCKNINISLIKENASNYLLARASNNGAKTLTIPADVPYMEKARFMVACSDNTFFNISGADLTIGKKPKDTNASGSEGGSMDFFISILFILGFIRIRCSYLKSKNS